MTLDVQDKISLRQADETAAMLELWLASWRATYDGIDFVARSDWFLRRLAELEAQGAVALCARAHSPPALTGFVIIDPKTGWLDQLCVHPDHFGTGVAQALLAAARRASPSAVRLDVNADNVRALRFYEREGFVRLGPGAPSRSGRATVVLEWLPRPNRPAR